MSGLRLYHGMFGNVPRSALFAAVRFILTVSAFCFRLLIPKTATHPYRIEFCIQSGLLL